MDWPKLNSPEDADATHHWARACLEMWETERAELLDDRDHYRKALEEIAGQDFRGNRTPEMQSAYRALTTAPSRTENP